MHELNYALRRIGQVLPVLILVTVVTFLFVKLIPGDPVVAVLGERASEEAVQALRKQWGLDQPLLTQYATYIRRLLDGDLGESLRYRAPVSELLPRRISVTGFLVIYSTLLSIALAIPLAFIAALHRDRWPDQVVRVATTLPLAAPGFWIGILLLLLFSLKLRWFPASGFGEGFAGHLRHLFLPALTLAHTFASILTRNLRSSLIDVLRVAYVDFARAKGLPGKLILARHVLRPALLSVVTLLGVHLAYSIGGSVVIETVFALPGLGTWMVESIFSRDLQVVQSLTLIFSFGAMAINLVTDLVYSLLDPRVSLQ